MPYDKYNSPKKKSNWVSRLKRKVKTSFRAKQRAAKETKRQKRYAEYYKKAGPKRTTKTYAQWIKGGEKKEGKKIAYDGQGRETADEMLRRLKGK